MNLNRFACTAVVVLSGAFLVAAPAAAQSSDPQPEPVGTRGISAEVPVPVSGIDVNRLPIDVQRIAQQYKQSQIREEREGLNLRYFVDVFAKAPNLVLFTKEDNLEFGPVPYGAPTHREMLEMMTPREFRHYGGINILNPTPKKK